MRERETEHERGRVRERETQNPKQAPGSELVSTEPDAGLELPDLGDHGLFNQLSHPGAPSPVSLKEKPSTPEQ